MEWRTILRTLIRLPSSSQSSSSFIIIDIVITVIAVISDDSSPSPFNNIIYLRFRLRRLSRGRLSQNAFGGAASMLLERWHYRTLQTWAIRQIRIFRTQSSSSDEIDWKHISVECAGSHAQISDLFEHYRGSSQVKKGVFTHHRISHQGSCLEPWCNF